MRGVGNKDSRPMMYPRCGQELIGGERFCLNCGEKLGTTAPGVFGTAWRFFTSPWSAPLGLGKRDVRSAFRFLAMMTLLTAFGGASLVSFYLILLGFLGVEEA